MLFPPLFLFSEKNLHLLHLISLQKMKKISYTPLRRYLWLSVMQAGPEKVMLNLYNKVLTAEPILKYWSFLENFFFAEFFFLFLLTIYIYSPKKMSNVIFSFR